MVFLLNVYKTAISVNASGCLIMMDGIKLKQNFKTGKQIQNNSNDMTAVSQNASGCLLMIDGIELK